MLSEIVHKSITAPVTHDLHSLYWHIMEQVKYGGPYGNTVTLKRLQAGSAGSGSQTPDEGGFGERIGLTLVAICKEMGITGWAVNT